MANPSERARDDGARARANTRWALVGAAVLLLTTALAWRADDGSAPEAPPPDYGLYRIYWSRADYAAQLRERFAVLDALPRYVMFYRDLPRLAFPQHAVDAIGSLGATPIVSLELWRWGDDETRYLPAILEGAYDDAFSSWARAAADDGREILLRFGFECNGDWFSWSGDPQAYVAAWRRAHALFAEQGADNVRWVWSPNVVSIPERPDNARHHYYPGDDVVDWVALDGYNFGDEHDEWHGWESFADVFADALVDTRARHPGKPIMIAETSSAADRRKAGWIHDAWAWLATQPDVRAVVWFDYDKRRQGEQDWRFDSSPAALAAFNSTFAARR